MMEKILKSSYLIETQGLVRGGNYFLHERLESQSSAIIKTLDEMIGDNKSVYLFSGYLDKRAKTANSGDTALAFAIRVGIKVPLYEVDNKFWFDHYFPGGFIIDETITFNIRFKANKFSSIKYSLASESGVGEADKTPDVKDLGKGLLQIIFPLGFKEGDPNAPKPGFRGCLQLFTSYWNG